MTADIRTAAQREAEASIHVPVWFPAHDIRADLTPLARQHFVAGAEWAAKRVTPTREQLIEALAARHWDRDSGEVEHWAGLTDDEKENVIENYIVRDSAEAIIRLMAGLAEGENDGSDI